MNASQPNYRGFFLIFHRYLFSGLVPYFGVAVVDPFGIPLVVLLLVRTIDFLGMFVPPFFVNPYLSILKISNRSIKISKHNLIEYNINI